MISDQKELIDEIMSMIKYKASKITNKFDDPTENYLRGQVDALTMVVYRLGDISQVTKMLEIEVNISNQFLERTAHEKGE